MNIFFLFTQLRKLEVFEADFVQVNPDSPQKQIRFLTLTGSSSFCLNHVFFEHYKGIIIFDLEICYFILLD
jgi:hypothetical protein